MAENPVVIAGSLSKEELEKSIKEIVNAVDSGMNDVSEKFDTKLVAIEENFKKAGTKIGTAFKDSLNSALGGSFDQLAAAMEKISNSGGKFLNIGFGGNSGAKDLLSQIEEVEEQIRELKIKGITSEEDKARLDAMVEKLQKLQEEKERLEQGAKTVGDLDKIIAMEEHRRKKMELDSAELLKQNELLQEQKDYRKEQLATEEQLAKAAEKEAEAIERAEAKKLKKAQEPYAKELNAAMTMPTKSIDQAQAKLDRLQKAKERMVQTGLFDEAKLNRAQNAIDNLQKKIQQMQSKAPKTLKDVMGMDESSVDAIAKKMQALKLVQVDTKNATQVNKLGNEYQRLSRLQAELLGKNIQLTHSNNYLAQSFGYIRNRIVYALTLGALSRFVKELYDVRSQYELLERSLGVLVGSFERGSQIFQELNQMALKSPFTLIELSTAAKQLTAYDFAADEVVNTTRRLADISAALGVPMERLTYNLGQIRAQTVLTARDARDFANAGLPIVKELADYYSMLEGRIVSTGDVYDRMKKKMVSYEDVLTIINKVTDEGGKFFDFQAKQAETLRVQLANLSLAWNNMLNEIGKNNSKALGAPVGALKIIFENWKELSHVISEVIVAYGAYRAYQLVINRLMGVSATLVKKDILANKEKIAVDLQREALTRKLSKEEKKLVATRQTITSQDYQNILSSRQLTKSQALLLVARNKNNVALTDAIVKMGLLTRAEIRNITTSKALQIQLNQVWVSLKSMMSGIASFAKANWWMLLVGALVETFHTYGEIQDQIKDVNKGIVDSAKESRESISDMLKEYGSARKRAKANEFSDEEGAKIWERIKEEIELSSAAGKTFVERLKQVADINQRISKGFDYLQMIHDVNGALEQIDEKAIEIEGDWSKWWTLWAGQDGLVENLKEYVATLEKMKKVYGTFESAQQTDQSIRNQGRKTVWSRDEDRLKDDIRTTTESMINAFQTVGITSGEAMREAFERSNQKILANANVSAKERLQYNILAEQDFIKVRIKQFDDEYEYEKQRGNKERAERVRLEKQAWIDAFGNGEVVSTAFFDFLKNQHSSEVSEMFGNMSKKEIDNLDWSKGRWHDWAVNMAKSFAAQNDIAFDKLKKHVDDANKWKIFIQMFITSQNKTLYDELTEQDKLAQDAQSRVERLEKFISDQKKKGLADEQKTIDAIKEQKTAQDDLNDALSKGGRLKESSKSGSKSQKDPLGDALTKELQLITDIQKLYKEYTKAGVDSETAKNAAAKEYQKTLEQTNKTLEKYGVEGLTGEKLATMDLRAMRDYYQSILDKVQSSPKAVEALEKAIRNLNIEITKEGQKTIIDSLNSELSKLKDEYELAVELDANPELGGVFADMMGLSKEELEKLPRDFEGVVRKLQTIVDKELGMGAFDVRSNLNKDVFDEWVKSNKYQQDSDLVAKLKAITEYANKVRLDETKKQIDDWNKLLEKYASYEYRRTQIMQEAERERETARKKGAGSDVMNAIDIREQRELAKLEFEQFQNSPTWIAATGDLAGLTHKAIGTLIDRLEQYKKKAKNLDPKQIKQINSALKKLYSEQRKGNPFAAISNAIDEANERFNDYQLQIGEAGNRIEELNEKLQTEAGLTEAEKLELADLIGKIKEWREEQEKVGKVSASTIVSALQTIKSEIDPITNSIGEMFSAFGDTEVAETMNKVSSILDKALSFAQIGASIGGGWGAVIGGVVGGLMGAITAWADEISGNAKITRQIEKSEREVKRLSNAYEELSWQADNAYGVIVSGAQQATIENKKLQLAEVERQLVLEKSRKAKYQDKDKIIELQGQADSLRREIKDASSDIVNDLLGISSAGDEITNLVQVMIDAFRNGEDAMEAFGNEWDKMIDNMILKLIVSKYLQTAWDNIMATLEGMKDEMLEPASKAKSDTEALIEKAKTADKAELMKMAGISGLYAIGLSDENAEKLRKKIIEQLNKTLQNADEELERASQDYTEWSLDYMMNEGLQKMKNAYQTVMEGIDQYYDFGELAESQKLSNLQQGIQGITEDTAGALESYMNSVSQQVYLHSDLLTQIRDAVVGFDLDVQLGVQSQMLLQLQNNYIVIQSMQSLMENWTTPAGNGIRVEVL